MADVAVPSIATVTQTSADTVLGVQGGAVKRMAASPAFTQLAATTGAALIGTAEGDTVADAIDGRINGDSGRKFRQFGGVIRQPSPAGTGWAFIDDAGHTPFGMTSITENADGTMTVTNSFTAAAVGVVAITPDEDYTASGLTVGASVTTSSQILSFYAPFEARLNNLTVAWGNYISTTDALFGCDTSTAGTDGKVVFTHPSITHVDSVGSPILVMKYMPSGTSNGNAEIVPVAVSKTGFTLQAMEPIAGKVAMDGAGAITVTSDLVTAPTATWSSSTNRLTIAHAQALSSYGYSIQEITGAYRCSVVNNTGASLVIEFYDWAGTKYTGATAPASFQFGFSVPGTAPGVWSAQNRIVVRRASVRVRCQDVAGTGNIWLAGTHEVA